MKIIDVAEFYTDQGGGVKTYINQKLEAGSKHGHEIVIVAPGKDWGTEERYGGRVIWVKGPRLPVDPRYYILWREKAVHRILDDEQPDVVEGSSPWTGGWFTARWQGDALKSFIFHQDPVAVYPQTLLSGWLGRKRVDKLFGFYWNYLKKLSNNFDMTLVSGDWLADRIETFGVKNPVPVPFGIDKSFFSPNRRDPKLRAKLLDELGLSEKATLLIAISRHHPEKRLGTMIEGFEKASAEQPMGLMVYGDGPLRKYVNFKSRNVDGLKIMGFTDNRDQLADILASSDYFVHGSSAETYGIVVAEAICSGIPVVVPRVGGAADLASPGYAETYQGGNPEALADALKRIINRDRESLVNACTDAAKNEVGTMDDHFELLFNTYEKLVQNKTR
ncbi:MAG: glycosyltransferase [Balneolaceae bacterium]|nr:glycosyltransferase [Balneolaceae bacterium]